MHKQYPTEFKLQVVRAYLHSSDGVRTTTRKFNLPSKNYVLDWAKSLRQEGLLSEDDLIWLKAKSADRPEFKLKTTGMTPREKMLEEENLRLRAENELLKKVRALSMEDELK